MKDLSLVIMAAGMGSRFGGLKQIEPVGPSGEIIADYSVYDAIRAGFTKVVFVIREEHLNYFKKNITKKYEDKIKVEFAFQELSKVPSDVFIPAERVKMLGTAHALYCAKDIIEGDFALINGDDFYGLDAFLVIKDFLENNTKRDEYVTVNYPVVATSSKNGKVKRGVCFTEGEYVLKNVESEITILEEKVLAKSLVDGHEYEISKDHPVSVNCFGFRHEFLDLLSQNFMEFAHDGITESNEFMITEEMKKLMVLGKIKVVAKTAKSKWMGITYKEDLPEFKENIKKLIQEGEYPSSLWN